MIPKLLLDVASGKMTRQQSLAPCFEQARSAAAAAIFSLVDGDGMENAAKPPAAGALNGVAVALTDGLLVKGLPNDASSALLAGFVPPYDSAAAEKVRAVGAVIVGKTRLPELGITPLAGEEAAADRSAEAVGAGMCHAVFGVDADGAFRANAAKAGQYGLKPTYGAVSRYGIVSAAPSLETVAVAASSPGGLASLMAVVGGHDPRDVATRPEALPDFPAEVRKSPKGMRVGVIGGLDNAAIAEPLAVLAQAGLSRVDVALPSFGLWDAVHSILYHAEASSQLGRYDGIRFGKYPRDAGDWDSVYYEARAGFSPAVKRAAMLGAFALSHEGIDDYYDKALRLREKIRLEFAAAWDAAEVVLAPAGFDPAGLAVRRAANLAGFAAIAPAGKPYEIWAAPYNDHEALKVAFALAS